MDPLTAIGLAGNIITFVDLSTKILSRTKELYESASGATTENDELESLTKNLKELAGKTRRQTSNASRDSRFGLNITTETVLDSLNRQCIQVSDELLEILDSVKVKGDGAKLKVAIQAVKTILKKDRIDALQQRLDRISKQLMDGVSIEQLEEINRRLREMAVENTRLEINRSKEIQELREDFNYAIENINANSGEEPMPGVWLVLSDTARRGKDYFAEQVILQSLRFSSIDSRYESIPEEHSNTFSWIFDEASPTKFVQWLKKEDAVYWISGKPGSGKSTLIKFVAAHEQTRIYLEGWAGDKKLIVANFYFWNASTHQSQKSQRGLLRTILYQILRQCPELIRTAYHDLWIALTSDGKVLKESRHELLTVPALLRSLRNISTSTASEITFCFFLDGLDEYDGRPTDIIEMVDILKSFLNVKICVSSRPWNEFEDHFGKDSPWKLYMQDLTRDDIDIYVKDTLGRNVRFQQLREEDPQCPDFVSNLVTDADGVFLWVFLVTRSLLEGLTNADRIKDLQNRLNEVPKDLEEYFRKILFSTENRYRTQTARIIIIALHAHLELPLMAYWVIDQEDPKYFFDCPVQTPTDETLTSRLDSMTRRLKVLTKGLLDDGCGGMGYDPENRYAAHAIFEHQVTFLHRTVKDYLLTPDAQTMLQSWLDDTFNIDWEICCALATLAKMAPSHCFARTEGIWKYSQPFFFWHALKLDGDPLLRENLSSLLNHLQDALHLRFEENQDELVEGFKHNENISMGGKLEADILIVSLCVCVGLVNFISTSFEAQPKLCKRVASHIPTLVWSMRGINGKDGERFQTQIRFRRENEASSMLTLLLNHGVDPNVNIKGRTEWRYIMEELKGGRRYDHGEERRQRSFEAINLLLKQGANFEQQCTFDAHRASSDDLSGESMYTVPASQLLKKWYDVDQFGVLEDIVKRREAKLRKNHGISGKMGKLKLWIASRK